MCTIGLYFATIPVLTSFPEGLIGNYVQTNQKDKIIWIYRSVYTDIYAISVHH